jgi:hypothetical protein
VSTARRAAAALAPDWVKRRHEALTTARYRKRVGELSRRFAAHHGLVVRRGPFEGLVYPESMLDADYLVSKIVGSYELEVHRVIEEWIARRPARVVNIGAAEGYFAVGLARALPHATVFAFEMDESARGQCVELAEANGVAARVQVAGECTVARLEELGRDHAVVLCDCEGCELELMDPARIQALRAWELLVELHDFVDPAISAAGPARFADSHRIELISSRTREHENPPELSELDPRERQLVLSERRPAPMEWAWLRPQTA